MNPSELFELIKSRRAVFPAQYSGETIPQAELDQIFEAANWAPNHKRTEPWRFKLVQGRAKQRFAEFMLKKYMDNTSADVQSDRKKMDILDKCNLSDTIVLIQMKNSGLLPEWEELAATAMAVQNMWLMCTALGIGSYWSSPSTITQMDEFMPMDENEKCIGIFYMGKLKNGLPEGNRKPMADKIQILEN